MMHLSFGIRPNDLRLITRESLFSVRHGIHVVHEGGNLARR